MTKTKKNLVGEVAKATGFTQSEVSAVINSFIDKVSKSILAGERIELRRFGRFYTKNRAPKQARNPKTGAEVKVPARIVPIFKASRFLLKAMQERSK